MNNAVFFSYLLIFCTYSEKNYQKFMNEKALFPEGDKPESVLFFYIPVYWHYFND